MDIVPEPATIGEAQAIGSVVWLRGVLVPFALALAVVLGSTPIVRALAVRLGCFDRPDGGLKPHEKPIPYLGGIAIYLGWLAALGWGLRECAGVSRELVGIVGAGTALALTGLVDDIRHVRPRHRLLIQAGCAALLVYSGVGQGLVPSLVESTGEVLPAWMASELFQRVMGAVLVMAVLAVASNATNLIDGMDGLCAGVVAISAVGFGIVSMARSGLEPAAGSMDEARLVLAAALLGSCLGFLAFNFHPASIFMGDSGSLLLGCNAAVLLILLGDGGQWRHALAAVTVFAFPIFDTALAVARRWLNGRPLFVGDRSHSYDQFRDRGLSVRQTVWVCYLFGAASVGVGWLLLEASPVWMSVIVFGAPIAMGLAARWMGFLRVDDAASRSHR